MSKHTAGPWQVCNTTISGAITHWHIAGVKHGSVYPICTHTMAEQPSGSEQLANAALIAAAPELLEALAYIYEDVRQGALPDDDDPWYERAAAVLAKAKGEI